MLFPAPRFWYTERMKKREGYVQVYTGNGKGKTTAALGLTVRALGAGLKVFIGQFLKTGTFSELKGLSCFGNAVTVEQYGGGKFIIGDPSEADKERAREGFARAREAAESGTFDVVILEEINVAVDIGLLPVEDVLTLITNKHPAAELVLTGRNAHKNLIEAADLVTEMKCVKHYFDRGIHARTGIEK